MSSPARDELLAVLDALEEADARNLAWGLTDESWTRDGLAEFIGRHTGAADPEACIDELLAGNLLVQLPREWPARYRTRMSEAVRLFTRLRQMFPGQPWQSGARLVSDFRFLRRPRAFPSGTSNPGRSWPTCASRNSPPRSSPRSSASSPGGTCHASSWALPRRSSPGLPPGPIAELSSARVRAAARRSRSTYPPCPSWRRRYREPAGHRDLSQERTAEGPVGHGPAGGTRPTVCWQSQLGHRRLLRADAVPQRP